MSASTHRAACLTAWLSRALDRLLQGLGQSALRSAPWDDSLTSWDSIEALRRVEARPGDRETGE